MADFGRTERALKTLTTASNTAAELNTYFGPVVSQAYNSNKGALAAIRKVRVANGDGTGWRTRTGRNTGVGSIEETDPVPASGNQARKKMKADWKINVASVGITGLMMAESQGGPADVVPNLLDDEMAFGMDDLLDYLEKCIFAQQGGVDYTKHIFSLPRIIDNVNGEVIYDKTRAGETYLNCGYKADYSSSPVPIEKDHIKALLGGIWDSTGEYPDMIFTTRALADRLEALWESESRAAPGEFEINAGFRVKRVYGVLVIPSQYCPAGAMFAVNSKYLEWRYLTMGQVEQLGKTKDADEFFIKDYEELVCTNIPSTGKILGLQ